MGKTPRDKVALLPEFTPMWGLLMAIKFLHNSNRYTTEQILVHIELLDNFHDGLLHVIETVERLANELQQSLRTK